MHDKGYYLDAMCGLLIYICSKCVK